MKKKNKQKIVDKKGFISRLKLASIFWQNVDPDLDIQHGADIDGSKLIPDRWRVSP